ncbi:lysosomal protective protein-like isoform X2 [Ylistrum balloti]|uniref:lysosomal protective protein-like isoform X2 n=1 Tax=Ylistrum balloti TaxID=509963 RepID=UPI002905A362|nr:lysosomal protective protein-like isoform X2 [Ylistrum balloti]
MMGILSLLLISCLIVSPVNSAPAEDEILLMPGLQKQPSWKQYSGYLNATGDKKLHYWFLESQNNPKTDPVVLWMNGGPGCSSDLGLLSEHGPFRINSDGETVDYNMYSWNTVANMIYLEAPAGVGYSYSPSKDYRTDDDQVAEDNHLALKQFFSKFPEYKANEFFVTGESYGGIYVPTLSARLVDDSSFNFQGFVVGNGLSDAEMNTDSLIYFEYYHGLIGDKVWADMTEFCCGGNITRCSFLANAKKSLGCEQLVEGVLNIVYSSGLNEYNLYAPCEGQNGLSWDDSGKKVTCTHINWPFTFFSPVQKQAKFLQENYDIENNVRMTPPCLNYDNVVKYMNSAEVRKVLHIPEQVQKWDICSSTVSLLYKTLYNSMKEQYLKVLSRKKRVMVYNGDVDMACNFLGDEWFVNSLGQKVITERSLWHIKKGTDQQVAGFVKQMENISLVTIKITGILKQVAR